LTKLSLLQVHVPTDFSFEGFFQENARLEDLSLRELRLPLTMQMALAEAISAHGLKLLVLDNLLDDNGKIFNKRTIGHMLQVLISHEKSSLEKFDLIDCRLGADGALVLARALGQASSLRRLSLRDRELGQEGLRHILHGLSSPKASLQSLAISHATTNNYSDIFGSDFASLFAGCHSLKELDLSWCYPFRDSNCLGNVLRGALAHPTLGELKLWRWMCMGGSIAEVGRILAESNIKNPNLLSISGLSARELWQIEAFLGSLCQTRRSRLKSIQFDVASPPLSSRFHVERLAQVLDHNRSIDDVQIGYMEEAREFWPTLIRARLLRNRLIRLSLANSVLRRLGHDAENLPQSIIDLLNECKDDDLTFLYRFLREEGHQEESCLGVIFAGWARENNAAEQDGRSVRRRLE
jgi:hypothetical protein